MGARLYAATALYLVASLVPAWANPPAVNALKEVKLDKDLSVRLPKSFQLQKLADKPLSYVAVGPSPDGSGKKRPAVLFFLSAPVDQQGRDAFLAGAKRAAANTMNRFGIRAKESTDIEKQNGIEGTNITAENDQGKSWWAVRTMHQESHSLQVIIGAFEKDAFDRLAEMVSDGSIIAK